MLWNASTINGFANSGLDGSIGSVVDLLFEDTTWAARRLVVETGSWLSGRKVLLPISALGKPEPSPRQIKVKLTMQQVKDSPGIDTDRSVSRQMCSAAQRWIARSPDSAGGRVPKFPLDHLGSFRV